MKIHFDVKNVTSKNYNLIVSNLILSQKHKFTYDDILIELKSMLGYVNDELKVTTEKALIRLRDDGFLNVLGSRYWIVDLKI